MNDRVTRHAAAHFLDSFGGQPMALDPAAAEHLASLARQVHQGSLTAAGMRAALSPADPSFRTSKSTAVLRLHGLLTPGESLFSELGVGTSVRAFMQELNRAAADSSVSAIAVLVDSPGGFVAMIPEAAAAMRSARQKKPVLAVTVGLNASAAYWVSSNASQIHATQSARLGSIGVYMQRVSIARRLQEDGVDVTTIAAGKYKSEGAIEHAMTEAERRALQANVDEQYDSFVRDLSLGRSVPESRIRAGYGEGRVLSAKAALAAGMLDVIALPEESLGRIASGRLTGSAARATLSTRARRDQELFAFKLALLEL